MTALPIYLNHPHSNAYGAAELKEYIRTNTYKGFVATMSAIVLAALISIFASGVGTEIINKYGSGTIDILPPIIIPEGGDIISPPVLPPVLPIEQVRTEYVAGRPNPVASDIEKDIGDFATVDQIDQSLSSTEGTLVKPEDIPYLINSNPVNVTNVSRTEQIPEFEEPSFVEKEPALDLPGLQRTVIYPQMAIRIGLEGTSIIRVLVDNSGKPVKSAVLVSAAPILDKAATEAVMKAIFTPAIQNGTAVSCWVNVPINFKLR